MRKLVPTITMAILATLLLVMTFLYYTKEVHPPRLGGPEGPGRGKALLKILDLTEEQQSQIEQFQSKNQEHFKEKREAFEQARKNLSQAMANPSSGDEEFLGLFEALEKAKNDMSKMQFEKALEIRKLLTPEQQKKMAEFKGGPPGMRRVHPEKRRPQGAEGTLQAP